MARPVPSTTSTAGQAGPIAPPAGPPAIMPSETSVVTTLRTEFKDLYTKACTNRDTRSGGFAQEFNELVLKYLNIAKSNPTDYHSETKMMKVLVKRLNTAKMPHTDTHTYLRFLVEQSPDLNLRIMADQFFCKMADQNINLQNPTGYPNVDGRTHPQKRRTFDEKRHEAIVAELSQNPKNEQSKLESSAVMIQEREIYQDPKKNTLCKEQVNAVITSCLKKITPENLESLHELASCSQGRAEIKKHPEIGRLLRKVKRIIRTDNPHKAAAIEFLANLSRSGAACTVMAATPNLIKALITNLSIVKDKPELQKDTMVLLRQLMGTETGRSEIIANFDILSPVVVAALQNKGSQNKAVLFLQGLTVKGDNPDEAGIAAILNHKEIIEHLPLLANPVSQAPSIQESMIHQNSMNLIGFLCNSSDDCRTIVEQRPLILDNILYSMNSGTFGGKGEGRFLLVKLTTYEHGRQLLLDSPSRDSFTTALSSNLLPVYKLQSERVRDDGRPPLHDTLENFAADLLSLFNNFSELPPGQKHPMESFAGLKTAADKYAYCNQMLADVQNSIKSQ